MHRKTVIDFRSLGERYTFTQPIKELKTRDLAEVADLLAQVGWADVYTKSDDLSCDLEFNGYKNIWQKWQQKKY